MAVSPPQPISQTAGGPSPVSNFTEEDLQDNTILRAEKPEYMKKRPRKFLHIPGIPTVPDHDTHYVLTKEGRKKEPPHKQALGVISCRWIDYKNLGIPEFLLKLGKKSLFTLDEEHPTRGALALNEAAEALKETLERRSPGAAKPVYWSLWGSTLAYIANRFVVSGMDEHSFTASIKSLTQDMLAGVTLPVIFVRSVCGIMNFALGKLKMRHSWLGDVVRPTVAFLTAKKSISLLDPIVKKGIKIFLEPILNKYQKSIDGAASRFFKSIVSLFFSYRRNGGEKII